MTSVFYISTVTGRKFETLKEGLNLLNKLCKHQFVGADFSIWVYLIESICLKLFQHICQTFLIIYISIEEIVCICSKNIKQFTTYYFIFTIISNCSFLFYINTCLEIVITTGGN